jgi:hypothetical protein
MNQILSDIIQLADARNIEESELKMKYDADGLGTNELGGDYFDEPRPKRKQLEEFLRKLTQEQLERVAAIMYGGRDYLTEGKKTPFKKVFARIKGDEHLDDMILEKKPLSDYLRAGMKLYGIDTASQP